MDKLDIQPEYHKDDLQERIKGNALYKAPQPITTALITGTLTSGGSSPPMVDSDALILTTLINSHNEVLSALIKLGLIKKHL